MFHFLRAMKAPVNPMPQPIETAPRDGTRILGWDVLNREWSIVVYSSSPDPAWNGWFHEGDPMGGAKVSHWLPMPEPIKA